MIHDTTQTVWWAGQDGKRSVNGQAVDKTAFLQLLVTQLKNQNPLEPMDNQQFLSQLAQFNALEQMQSLNEQMQSLVTVQVAAGQDLKNISGTLAELLKQQAALQSLLSQQAAAKPAGQQ